MAGLNGFRALVIAPSRHDSTQRRPSENPTWSLSELGVPAVVGSEAHRTRPHFTSSCQNFKAWSELWFGEYLHYFVVTHY